MSKLKIISISALSCAALFTAFSLVFYFGDWVRLLLVAALGIFVGLLAAPSIEPKAFKHAWAYELSAGAMAGALAGFIVVGSGEAAGAGALIGGVLGFMAPYWIRYVTVP